MSQQPPTPAAKPKRAIEEAISPPPLRQPAKKKRSYNLPRGGVPGRPRKQAPVTVFDPIEFKPYGTPTTSTASPTVAPKKATSRVSASSAPLTGGPRTDLSQAVVEDTTGSVEVSVEEDDTVYQRLPLA